MTSAPAPYATASPTISPSAASPARRAVPREAFVRRFAVPSPDGRHRAGNLDGDTAYDEALEIRDGMTVLDVGTGTGHNAAPLSHRLGSARVTSADLDPGLVAAARAALGRLGHQPLVVCGDGLDGCPARAPYDRLIATCGVRRVPGAWLRQVWQQGVIVASVGPRPGPA